MQSTRYELQLQKFKTALIKAEELHNQDRTQHIAHILYELDARTPFFQLQGLARIDSNISKHKDDAEKWLLQFKKMEDAFGQYDFWYALESVSIQKKLDQKIIDFIKKQTLIHLGLLEAALIESGWISKENGTFKASDAPLMKLAKKFKKIKWLSHEKERNKLVKFLVSEMNEIEEKLKSGELDLTQIEEGIHELRRKLRWLGIYSSALNGKIVFPEISEKLPLNHKVTKKALKMKFNQLPDNAEELSKVYFLPGGFIGIGEIIYSIGEIKDPALITEELTKIATLTKSNVAKLKKALGKDYMTHETAIELTKDLLAKSLTKEEILKHSIQYFKQQL